MYKENELKSISSGKVVDFLISRFNKNLPKATSYRGKHYFQHSRSSIDQFISTLNILHNIVGKNWMPIPPGDEYNPIKNPGGYKLGLWPEYEKVVSNSAIAGFSSKWSSQSIKKIEYTNLERMGLLERGKENSTGDIIKNDFSKQKFLATHVRISHNGFQLIQEKNHITQKSIVAKGFKRLWGHEYDILHELIFSRGLNKISIDEYALFASWIEYDGSNISIDKCEELILLWRGFSKNKRESILHFFKSNAKGSESKTSYEYWHWTNWKNEPASIFQILGGSGLLKFDKGKGELISTQTSTGSFKRAKDIMIEYDKEHGIEKKDKESSGFEYHHIIPFAWVSDVESHNIIDNSKNCLYLSGTMHNKIPKKNNTLVKLSANDDEIILSSKNGTRLILKNNVDVIVSAKMIKQMIKYNFDALKVIK